VAHETERVAVVAGRSPSDSSFPLKDVATVSSYHARALQLTEEIFKELENRHTSDSTVALPFESVTGGPVVQSTMTPEYFEAFNEILEIQKNLLRFVNKHLS
jgi:methylmalonyl-CoA mutase cobalamin-binding subunit